jgi:hypothetical protein
MTTARFQVLRSACALGLAALALSACQTGRPTAPVTTVSPNTAPASAPASTPLAAAPAPQAAARPLQPAVNDDPDRLMGLDRDGLAAVLGSPSLIRREAPAEIWQYVTSGCVFEVVLYERDQRYAVSYLEARDGTALRQEPRPCLNQLLRELQAAPVS